MGITMGDLGDYMMIPGVDPSFVSGRPGQFTPEARAVMQAATVAANLRAAGYPEQPPAPLPPTAINPAYGGCLPVGCCPPPGTEELCSRQSVTPNTLDVTPAALRYATGDGMPGVSPKVTWEQVSQGGGDLNAMLLKPATAPLTLPPTRVWRGAQNPIDTYSARVATLNMASGGVGQQTLQMARAYTTPTQMMGLGDTAARRILAATMFAPQNPDVRGTVKGLGETAALTGRFREHSAIGALGAEQSSAGKTALTKLVREAEAAWDAFKSGTPLPQGFKGGLDALRNVLTQNRWTDATMLPEILGGYPSSSMLLERVNALHRLAIQAERPAAIGKDVITSSGAARYDSPAAAGAKAGAGVVVDRAKSLYRQATAPLERSWGILEWITEHPVLTAAGVVAAGAAVSYAYGRGRR